MTDPDAPRTSFRDLPTAAFVERLASSDPVPGGGSASAVAASYGAALVAMVASLSVDRPKYAEHAALHRQAIETGNRLADRLLQLADDDTAAYARLSAAMKLPRETDAEKATRQAAMEAAALEASEVPLATVEACLELVAMAESLAGRSNRNASSDLNVAALLGEAAGRGAAENVLVNLPMLSDESRVGELTSRVMGLLDDVEQLAAEVHATVRSGESRDPLPA